MSSSVADKKREHEIAAEQFLSQKDYEQAFFHTARAAEFTLELAQLCDREQGLAYIDDAHGLLDVAEEIKAIMSKKTEKG